MYEVCSKNALKEDNKQFIIITVLFYIPASLSLKCYQCDGISCVNVTSETKQFECRGETETMCAQVVLDGGKVP